MLTGILDWPVLRLFMRFFCGNCQVFLLLIYFTKKRKASSLRICKLSASRVIKLVKGRYIAVFFLGCDKVGAVAPILGAVLNTCGGGQMNLVGKSTN